MQKNQIAMIGLAVMGANLARNLASKGFRVGVYNRSKEVTQAFDQKYKENLTPYYALKDLVESLERPRKIMIMVKAGAPVDAVIAELSPLLERGDMIIDCGNSYYEDSIRRESTLREKWIAFVGCGVSGGEEWALHGPSIMPGCTRDEYLMIEPFLSAIAAKDFSWNPCVTHVGNDGAGHFVKMVHNGIEYAVMEMMAEAYEVLRKGYHMSPWEISQIFAKYNLGLLDSYLFEIAVEVLAKKDDQKDGFLLDAILDVAGAKGTGLWTSEASLRAGKPTPSIVDATFARMISAEKPLRTGLAKNYEYNHGWLPPKEVFIPQMEHALYLGLLSAYSQWLTLIYSVAEEKKWNIHLAEITRIWQGGCIIRSQILSFLTEAFGQEKSIASIFALPKVIEAYHEYLPDYQKVLSASILASLPTPSLSSAYNYFLSLSTRDSSANFIQGLRDYFWAHTYARNDREGIFHTDWNL